MIAATNNATVADEGGRPVLLGLGIDLMPLPVGDAPRACPD
jgi:hypothetical protein